MVMTPNQVINSPADFARVFLRIQDKDKKLVPFKWNRAQAHFHANRTGRDLILKARQLGFSTYVQGEMFRRTVTGTRTTITLAHDADTTAKLRLMADRFYENCKFGNIQPARKYANASLTTYPEFDSAATIATAGNVETGRGGTYSDFHGSEVAFWKDAERIIAGAMQGGSPDVVLESTPNGAQGYFYERCMEALHGDSIWTLHFYAWWWDDDYRIPLDERERFEPTAEELLLCDRVQQPSNGEVRLTHEQLKWRRLKQKELGRFFSQEYPEDVVSCFLTSGNSYFGDTSQIFTAPMQAVYNPNHEYVAGLDFGQTTDPTSMTVWDVTDKVQVDLLRLLKLPWTEQRQRIHGKYKYWHCDAVGAEENSIGSVNIEELRKLGMNVSPFTTTNASKADMMANQYECLHNRGWRMQDHPVQRHEYNTFIATQLPSGMWRLAADGDGHDDTVISGGIGLWTVVNRVHVTKQPMQKSKFKREELPAGWARKY